MSRWHKPGSQHRIILENLSFTIPVSAAADLKVELKLLYKCLLCTSNGARRVRGESWLMAGQCRAEAASVAAQGHIKSLIKPAEVNGKTQRLRLAHFNFGAGRFV